MKLGRTIIWVTNSNRTKNKIGDVHAKTQLFKWTSPILFFVLLELVTQIIVLPSFSYRCWVAQHKLQTQPSVFCSTFQKSDCFWSLILKYLECMAFIFVLCVLNINFRAKTQLFKWTSPILFFVLLELVTQIIVLPSFSYRCWVAQHKLQTQPSVFCSTCQKSECFWSLILKYLECVGFILILCFLNINFRAKTQLFKWTSPILFFVLLELVTQIIVLPSFSYRCWVAQHKLQTQPSVFCSTCQKSECFWSLILKYLECMAFIFVLCVLNINFRAKTQLFKWTSPILFFVLLELVTQIIVLPSFSYRCWVAQHKLQTQPSVFCSTFQKSDCFWSLILKYLECMAFIFVLCVLNINFRLNNWVLALKLMFRTQRTNMKAIHSKYLRIKLQKHSDFWQVEQKTLGCVWSLCWATQQR